MFIWMSLAFAGRFDPWAPGPEQLGVYVGGSRSHFTTEFWTEGDVQRTFELPATVTTWQATGIVDVGVREHLAVSGTLPIVVAQVEEQSERICDAYGMCDPLTGLGDVRLALRSPWRLGSLDVAAAVEIASGLGYRHGIDDLAAPGDGNTDLVGGGSVGWRGADGELAWALSGGALFEWGLGRPPSALDLSAAASARWRWIEVGASVQRYDSLGGLDFNSATAGSRLDDPERFTVIENDFTQVAPRLSVMWGAWGLHAAGWKLVAVDSGPEDLRGASLGLSYWKG